MSGTISNLSPANDVHLTDVLPTTQGSSGSGTGTTKKATVAQLLSGVAKLPISQSAPTAGDHIVIARNGGAVLATPQDVVAAGGGSTPPDAVLLGAAESAFVPVSDVGHVNATASGASSARTLGDRFSELVSVADFGAKPAFSASGCQMTAGSNVLYCPAGGFTSAMAGMLVDVSGAGPSQACLSTTVAAFVDAQHLQLTATASTSVPFYGATALTLGATTASGYLPGDTIGIVPPGGTTAIATSSYLVVSTKVAAAAIANAGSGGTSGTYTGTATTGTPAPVGVGGVAFYATFTVVVGNDGRAASVTILTAGSYFAGPNNGGTTVPAEPISMPAASGLTGLTLALSMAPLWIQTIGSGAYSAKLLSSTTLQTTTNGAGAGLTANVSISPGYGGQATVYKDAGPAVVGAANVVNTRILAGLPAALYIPPGVFGMRDLQHDDLGRSAAIPIWKGSAGILGSHESASRLFLSPAHNAGATLFAWQDANIGGGYPIGGQQITPNVGLGPFCHGFSIFGDRSMPSATDALSFFGHCTQIAIDGLTIAQIKGRGISFNGTTLSGGGGGGFVAETRLHRIRLLECGDAGIPALVLNCTVGNCNEVRMNLVDIFAPYGVGFLISGGGTVTGCQFYSLRIEGLVTQSIPAPLMQISGTGVGAHGNLKFFGSEFLSPQVGQYALEIVADGTSAQPYGVRFYGGSIGGGVPNGRGVHIGAGRDITLDLGPVTARDYDFVIDAAPLAAARSVMLRGNPTADVAWSVLLDASNVGLGPIVDAYGLGAPGAATLPMPVSTVGAANATGYLAEVIGGTGKALCGLGNDGSVQFSALAEVGFLPVVLPSSGTYTVTAPNLAVRNLGSAPSNVTIVAPVAKYNGLTFAVQTQTTVSGVTLTTADTSTILGWPTGQNMPPGTYAWRHDSANNVWLPWMQSPLISNPATELVVPALARRSGRFYFPRALPSAQALGAANRLYAADIELPSAIAIKTLQFNIAAAFGSAFNLRFGLYSDNGGAPSSLLYDSGAIAVTGSQTGAVSVTIAGLTQGPGLVWPVFLSDTAGVSITSISPSGAGDAAYNARFGTGSAAAAFAGTFTPGCYGSLTFGALPAQFPSIVWNNGSNAPFPVIGI